MKSKDLHSPLPAQQKTQASPGSIQPQPKERHTRQRIIVIPLRRFKPHRRIQIGSPQAQRPEPYPGTSSSINPYRFAQARASSTNRRPNPNPRNARSTQSRFISQPNSSHATHRKQRNPPPPLPAQVQNSAPEAPPTLAHILRGRHSPLPQDWQPDTLHKAAAAFAPPQPLSCSCKLLRYCTAGTSMRRICPTAPGAAPRFDTYRRPSGPNVMPVGTASPVTTS
jgi:hypothetical protein